MDIYSLFPELNEITDEGLRIKTKQSLEKGIHLGGWTEEDFKSIPFTLLIPELVGSNQYPQITIVDHLRAVTQLCISVYEKYKIFGLADKLNRDELISAGILHDIGKFVEYERNDEGRIVQSKHGKYLRHPMLGLELVYEFDLPLTVRQAIAFHSKEGDMIERLPEVDIVHRCDFLCFSPIKKIYANK